MKIFLQILKIEANFKIETQSKITRLISPFLKKLKDKNYTYNIKYSEDYKKAEIEYKNGKFAQNNEDENLSILFRTEFINKPIIYCQYNPELKETAYSINYTYTSKYLKDIPISDKPDENSDISYIFKYEKNEVNETPGLFIFLIDQSGSMSGNRIKLVKKSLLLFIQSLPEESYFQLIGFGSNYNKYNEKPVIYNKENVEKIINIINLLDANLGGTNISGPLKEIYSDECYSKINFSKNIFLLTDGVVWDREECFEVINKNSGKFRIHSIGIGSGFDKVLIERCGKLGKGTSSFVLDMNNINSVVIDALNNALRPYITNIKFEFENYKEELASSIIKCNPVNNFSYQNEIMNYSFILPGGKELSNLKIKISGKDPINLIENNICFDNILKLENGEDLSKMIVGKALKNNEELIKDEKKEIEFAKKYQILSKNTALFAEILNEEKQQYELIKVDLFNTQQIKTMGMGMPTGMRMGMPPIMGIGMPPMPPGMGMQPGMGMGMPTGMRMGMPPIMGMGMPPIMGIPSMVMGQSPPYSQSQPMFQMNLNNMNNNMSTMNNMNNNLDNNMNSSNNNFSLSSVQSNITKTISKDNKINENKEIDLIMSQDIIEGSWNENEATKKIIDIISEEKFNIIKSRINTMNKGENEIKIIYTIMVIYYIKTKHTEKLNEYKLIIKKAIKFLQKNGIDYDAIISDI